jgi:hypothetical protein
MTNEITQRKSPAGRRSFFQIVLSVLRLIGINFVIFAILAELVSIVFVHLKNWPASRPTYHLTYNLFWADINPDFGVWHRPNGYFYHQMGCFSVEYTTNSYGARDKERSLHSTEPRTVVLGDSFIEGFGLPDQERLTNILERDTGREHLNFGTGGDFSPLQYAILYKTLASKFDHDQVLVGVLPDNDFFEMRKSFGEIQAREGRYGPYYDDNLSVIYLGHFNPKSGESRWDHVEAWMRAYMASYHVGQYVISRFYWRRRRPYSGYNDYTDLDLIHLKKALLDIKGTADAHGAKMAVFLIPRANDFKRLHETGADRLGPGMESWGRAVGIPVKDLLPEMDARSGGDYRSYFHACDGHWSAKGNAMAADILETWLGEKKSASR